jgi:DNA modification methylase
LAIVCLELERNYIRLEKDKGYFEIGQERIKEWHEAKKLLYSIDFLSYELIIIHNKISLNLSI